MSNTDYLYNELLEINKKYESTTFVDIDFIELFCLKSINISNLKKIITNKYYNLALKYHPDKYKLSTELIISINNISIDINEIRSGQFLSFITDIYKMLINMITIDNDNLIRIIDGDGSDIQQGLNYGGDHSKLKQHFNNKSYDNSPFESDIKFNNEVIIDTKIDKKELQSLINVEQEKRLNLSIDKIFSEEDIKLDEFNNIFNDKFESIIINTK